MRINFFSLTICYVFIHLTACHFISDWAHRHHHTSIHTEYKIRLWCSRWTELQLKSSRAQLSFFHFFATLSRNHVIIQRTYVLHIAILTIYIMRVPIQNAYIKSWLLLLLLGTWAAISSLHNYQRLVMSLLWGTTTLSFICPYINSAVLSTSFVVERASDCPWRKTFTGDNQ